MVQWYRPLVSILRVSILRNLIRILAVLGSIPVTVKKSLSSTGFSYMPFGDLLGSSFGVLQAKVKFCYFAPLSYSIYLLYLSVLFLPVGGGECVGDE